MSGVGGRGSKKQGKGIKLRRRTQTLAGGPGGRLQEVFARHRRTGPKEELPIREKIVLDGMAKCTAGRGHLQPTEACIKRGGGVKERATKPLLTKPPVTGKEN